MSEDGKIEDLNENDSSGSDFNYFQFSLVILSFIFLQSMLGLFDPIESRSNHAEHSAHFAAAGENFIDNPDCKDIHSEAIQWGIGKENCWHYGSRYAAGEIILGFPSMIVEGFVALKIYATLLAILEATLLALIIFRFSNNRLALASAIVYLSLPSTIYYAQLLHGNRIAVISTLLASYWSVPYLFNKENHSTLSIARSWAVLAIPPFLVNIVAFAWAGIAACVLFLSHRTLRQRVTFSSIIVLFPVFAFLLHLQTNQFFEVNSLHMSNRLDARSNFSLFFTLNYWLVFADRISWLLGPIGILLIILLCTNLEQIKKCNSEIVTLFVSLLFLGLFTIMIFNAAFYSCCRYFAYPLGAASAIIISIVRPNFNFGPIEISAIVVSITLGLSLHAMPLNYSDRALQEFAQSNFDRDDNISVVIDDNYAVYNGFRWRLPGDWIEIDVSENPQELEDAINTNSPDYIILSNEIYSIVEINASLSSHGYCYELISPNENIPDNLLSSHLAHRLPSHSWTRC